MTDRETILNARIPLHDRLKLLIDKIEVLEVKLGVVFDYTSVCYFQWFSDDENSCCKIEGIEPDQFCPACKIKAANETMNNQPKK